MTGHYNAHSSSNYTCEFDANKGLFGNFNKKNLAFTQSSLDQKRASFASLLFHDKTTSSLYDRKFSIIMAENYMEFLHAKDIKGERTLCSIAFPEKCYVINYSGFNFHHPLLIYNIFNSNFQLNKFLEYVYVHPQYENGNIMLRFLDYDENKLKELYSMNLDKKYKIYIGNSSLDTADENNKELGSSSTRVQSTQGASSQQPREQPENNVSVASFASFASNASANASNTQIEDIYDVSDHEE
jgi:hypothetical protein